MPRLSQLFPRQIALSYGCPDRIVIRGYYPALQREENVIHFFHDVAGLAIIDGAALASRTERYKQWLDGYLKQNHITRIVAPKGVRKEDLVQPYYRRLGKLEGIACVLTSMEQSRTFVSYLPRYKTLDPCYRIIKSCFKRFQHLYFYVFDRVMGPMALCVATYLPFGVQLYLNGHNFLAQQLTLRGVRFGKHDNALLWVDDVEALREVVDSLTPELLEQRAMYWTRRLAPSFTPAERTAANLRGYAFSIAQLEYAHDTIFRHGAPLQEVMRRTAQLGGLLGGADRTVTAFGRHINRRYNGKLMTVLEGADQGHPSLRAYYKTSFVKLYTKPDRNNVDRCLRAEVCLNSPDHLGVQRSLKNLPELLDKMSKTADRYLDLHADLLDTTVDRGELADLTQPTIRGRRRIPGIRLHDDRLLRLLDVLLQPAGLIANWTIADLHARVLQRHHLSPTDYRTSQLRYDLTKLRAKNLVERIGSSRRYRVTPLGFRLGTVLVKVRFRLLGPLVTSAVLPRPHSTEASDPIEIASRKVDSALDEMFTALCIRTA